MNEEWPPETTCCFTGNRNIELSERDDVGIWLDREIANLAGQGIACFWAGGAVGFDTMAAQAVLRYKSKIPGISLGLALPCRNMDGRWPERDRRKLAECINAADRVVYVSQEYFSGCMHLRNRFMVDGSSVCLYYSARKGGGTVYTVRYAQKQGLRMIAFKRGNELSGQIELL